jgi:hypothetical protein
MVLTLQNLKLGGNLEFSWYSCNILADVSAQESIDVIRLLSYCAYVMVP